MNLKQTKNELKKAVSVLKKHNKWRRGDERIKMTSPKTLGIAIDVIIKHYNDGK